MSPFELFFSLFGLILGLAMAVIISGVSDVLRERVPEKLGWLTPMLAVFMLFDLASLWVNAGVALKDVKLAYGPFLGGTIVAGVYFFAATMVFPKTLADWPSLDDYYMRRHRYVLGGVYLGNLGIVLMGAVSGQRWQDLLTFFVGNPLSASWWVIMTTLLLLPFRKVQLVGLAALLVNALVATVWFWS